MFTPVETTIGALLIQFATTSYLLNSGKTIGFSSTFAGIFFNTSLHNLAVLAGLSLSALITYFYIPGFIPTYPNDATVTALNYVISGSLVGLGTKWGSGCTSGHMINGFSRLRVRSIIATIVFCAAAMTTTYVLDIAPSCGAEECYHYDVNFTRYHENCSQLLTILCSGFAMSYIILPFITSKMANTNTSLAQFINGVNAGLLFGLGLVISGMASPSKTLGFLAMPNLAKFDPSLALIIVFCIIPNMIIWNFYVLQKPVSLSGQKFDLPMSNKVPLKFILGNLLFGMGWGSLGVCPGPGLLANFFNGSSAFIWSISFLVCYKIAAYI